MLTVLFGLQKLSLLLGVGIIYRIVTLLLELLLEIVVLEFRVVARDNRGILAHSSISFKRWVLLPTAVADLLLRRMIVAPLGVLSDFIAFRRSLVTEALICTLQRLVEGPLIGLQSSVFLLDAYYILMRLQLPQSPVRPSSSRTWPVARWPLCTIQILQHLKVHLLLHE